jgi:hypothetical protein
MAGKDRKEVFAQQGRLEKKTRDSLFRYSLETEFEFSPKVAEGVLGLVNDLYFDLRPLGEGQIRYIAVSKGEGSGKRMEELEKVEVILTKEAPWDEELRKDGERGALRRVQILRMTEEAYDQGALLTQEDLARILGVSVRQIRRDISRLRQQGCRLYLRGAMRDIGRGVSHKVWIVELYLEWKTYTEIKRITGHGVGSIKAYLNDLSRVLMNLERGITDVREISFNTGKSERLVQEYVELIKRAEADEFKSRRLASMKEQLAWLRRAQEVDFKKRPSCMVWRLI